MSGNYTEQGQAQTAPSAPRHETFLCKVVLDQGGIKSGRKNGHSSLSTSAHCRRQNILTFKMHLIASNGSPINLGLDQLDFLRTVRGLLRLKVIFALGALLLPITANSITAGFSIDIQVEIPPQGKQVHHQLIALLSYCKYCYRPSTGELLTHEG